MVLEHLSTSVSFVFSNTWNLLLTLRDVNSSNPRSALSLAATRIKLHVSIWDFILFKNKSFLFIFYDLYSLGQLWKLGIWANPTSNTGLLEFRKTHSNFRNSNEAYLKFMLCCPVIPMDQSQPRVEQSPWVPSCCHLRKGVSRKTPLLHTGFLRSTKKLLFTEY